LARATVANDKQIEEMKSLFDESEV